MQKIIALLGLLIATAAPASPAATETPAAAAARELMAHDTARGAEAARTDLLTAIGAVLAEDVTMPTPDGSFARGRSAALAALRANPDNATSTVAWTPVRAFASSDGRDGVTLGYMTVTKADGTKLPAKYLSYWRRGDDGWHVVAYRRSRAPAPPTSLAALPPVRAAKAVAAGDPVAEITAREKAFSDEAQRIGLGPAFKAFGSVDSVNLGPGADVLLGAEAIGESIGAGAAPGEKSPVVWSADRAIAAASGDLGVTFGIIRSNDPKDAGGAPFFTVWRRLSADDEWRYVAE